MSTPDPAPFGDAAEADVVVQRKPVVDGDQDTWSDAQGVGEGRNWQASEADLIEQAIAVPDDESEFDR